jgi:hypothetical protein
MSCQRPRASTPKSQHRFGRLPWWTMRYYVHYLHTRIHPSCHISFCRPVIPPAWDGAHCVCGPGAARTATLGVSRPPGSDDPWAVRPECLGERPFIGYFCAVSTQTREGADGTADPPPGLICCRLSIVLWCGGGGGRISSIEPGGQSLIEVRSPVSIYTTTVHG